MMNLPFKMALYAGFTALILSATVSSTANREVRASTAFAQGWHPWYEIKADPENAKNLIVCGTKWSVVRDGPFGVVYSSLDAGATWQLALEDKHSSWVTEQSCAFGPGHRAYFISEASRVIDGQPHHSLGTTRLYVSKDAGQHWQNTIETRWADWSTSAVSRSSDVLLTFFNAITYDPNRQLGGTVGLLVFPSDGNSVTGPLFDSRIQRLGYQGVYPQDAVALASGAVVALYYGTKQSSNGLHVDLGIVRASSGQQRSLASSVLARTVLQQDCLSFDRAALAYQPNSNRLALVYVEGCADAHLLLTWSNDDGRSWSNVVQVADVSPPIGRMSNLSLTADADGRLWVLWEAGARSGHWLLSYVQNGRMVKPPSELSAGTKDVEITKDALWSAIGKPTEDKMGMGATIGLTVRSDFDTVWRGDGLISAGTNVLAVWPSGSDAGMSLTFTAVKEPPSSNFPRRVSHDQMVHVDATGQAVLVYGGIQEFDSATGVINVCLELGNRGDAPMKTPIEIVAEQLNSSVGSVSVLNSTNGRKGVGAVWDVSQSITGAEIPPFTNSNAFCLRFQLIPHRASRSQTPDDDLLTLKLKVLVANRSSRAAKFQSLAADGHSWLN